MVPPPTGAYPPPPGVAQAPGTVPVPVYPQQQGPPSQPYPHQVPPNAPNTPNVGGTQSQQVTIPAEASLETNRACLMSQLSYVGPGKFIHQICFFPEMVECVVVCNINITAMHNIQACPGMVLLVTTVIIFFCRCSMLMQSQGSMVATFNKSS